MDYNDFVKEYRSLVERVLLLAGKATHEGILSLEEMIDEEKYIRRDIFEYGLKLICAGVGDTFIDTVLTNIIEQETDENKKLLGKIQKQAVLGFEYGMGQKKILMLLNSFVNIDVEDTMKKCNGFEKLEMENWKSKRIEELEEKNLKLKKKIRKLKK